MKPTNHCPSSLCRHNVWLEFFGGPCHATQYYNSALSEMCLTSTRASHTWLYRSSQFSGWCSSSGFKENTAGFLWCANDEKCWKLFVQVASCGWRIKGALKLIPGGHHIANQQTWIYLEPHYCNPRNVQLVVRSVFGKDLVLIYTKRWTNKNDLKKQTKRKLCHVWHLRSVKYNFTLCVSEFTNLKVSNILDHSNIWTIVGEKDLKFENTNIMN